MAVTTQTVTPSTLPGGTAISTTRADGGLVQVVQLDVATVPVSIAATVNVSNGQTQPLTDTQLRATAVPVSAAALPLPTGAATEAGHLATIDTSTAKIPAQGQALAAASMPVVLTAAQITTLTPLASVGVNNFPATQAVSMATNPADLTASGTLAAAAQTVALALGAGMSAGAVQLTGTWVGTVTFEATVDGTNWVGVNAVSASTSQPQTTTTVNGLYRLTPGGLQSVRANMTAYTSGTATVSLRASSGSAGVFANQILPSKITDGTNTMPTGDAAARSIHMTVDNTTLAVTLATAPSTPVTNVGTFAVQAAATLAAETTKVIGTVNVAAAQTIATTNAGTFAVQAAATLAAETTKVIGTVNLSAAQTLATVTTVGTVTTLTGITNALPAGTNKVGTVDIATAPATAKGTQGANAVPTQDLKDAGRNPIHFYTVLPVLTTITDTLQSLTGTKTGATVVATTTPAVVTTGKTLRITRVSASYVATATSGYGIVKLRFNTGGVVAVTSPVASQLVVGTSAPVTANAVDTQEAAMDEGWEFAASTGIGISVQGFAGVTATAVGYITVSVTGYEY